MKREYILTNLAVLENLRQITDIRTGQTSMWVALTSDAISHDGLNVELKLMIEPQGAQALLPKLAEVLGLVSGTTTGANDPGPSLH